MNSIDYLTQAKLADYLGKYKLADSFYEKAIRLAAPKPPPFVPIEAGLRAAAETALRDALVSGEEAAIRNALKGYGFTEEGIAAIEGKLGKLNKIPQNININTLVSEAGGRSVEVGPSSFLFRDEIHELGKMGITELKNFLRLNFSELSAPQIRKTLRVLTSKLNSKSNYDHITNSMQSL